MPGRTAADRSRRRVLGQHLLGSAAVASQLVADAGVGVGDRIVELGAGTGVLTAALAHRAAHVLAVELDAALADDLARRFAAAPNVSVFRADALDFVLPANPYRIVANPPFGRTSALLHRLLDVPAAALVRADLVVQWQVARARVQAGSGVAGDLVGTVWGPWWSFARGRRLPARLFRPPPRVDAAVLIVSRREPRLLPARVFDDYARFVRRGFGASSVDRLLDLEYTKRERRALAVALHVDTGLAARELDVAQWITLFRAMSRSRR